MQIINVHNIHCWIRPSLEEMLDYDLWELHEAAFILTSWPEFIVKVSCENYSKLKNISRAFFYEAGPPYEDPTPIDWKFNPITLGTSFIKIYAAMEKAVKNGSLDARGENLGIGYVYSEERISYFVSPRNMIRWALLNGIDIPEDIQDAIGLHITGSLETLNKRKKTVHKKVQIKIRGQFLRYYFPGERTSYYCKHPWMKIMIEELEREEECDTDKFQVIRIALNELRNIDPNRKQGNRSKEDINNEIYHPKAIREVICNDASGIKRYHIPLLKVAMKTAAEVLISMVFEGTLPIKNINEFLNEFMKNDVVSLYIEEASPIISEFVREFAYSAVADFFIVLEMESLVRSGKFFWRKH